MSKCLLEHSKNYTTMHFLENEPVHFLENEPVHLS